MLAGEEHILGVVLFEADVEQVRRRVRLLGMLPCLDQPDEEQAVLLDPELARRRVALLRAQSVLDRVKGTEDEKIGVEIVRKAIEEPIRMIVQNAGAEGSIIVAKIRESKDKNFGYNAATDTYEDLVKAGVIDPTKVTRTALQNAASIASLLLTTEAIIVEKKEEKGASAPQGGGGGMGGMY